MLAWQWTRIGQAAGSFATASVRAMNSPPVGSSSGLVAHVVQSVLADEPKLVGPERTALGSVFGEQVDDGPEVMPLLGQLEPPVGGHGADVDPVGNNLAKAMESAAGTRRCLGP